MTFSTGCLVNTGHGAEGTDTDKKCVIYGVMMAQYPKEGCTRGKLNIG